MGSIMILGTIVAKISVATMLAASLPTSIVTTDLPSLVGVSDKSAINAPTTADNWRALEHLGGDAALDFTQISLTTEDLRHEGDAAIELNGSASAFNKAKNIIEADARAGTSLKYYNIATFTLGKNTLLSKENKPTLFGEKVLAELTGITLAK